jgi:hypothetical protein
MNRREAEELLPWYLAGALTPEETDAVQAFVDRGEISPAKLEDMRFLGAAIGKPGARTRRYDPQILQRVLEGLEGIPRGGAVDEEPLVVVREDHRPSRGTPPLARAVIAVQFALLLGLALALTMGDAVGSDDYPAIPPGMLGDYTLTFAPGVTEAQVRALLLDSRAIVVAGPSSIGLYTIVLDADVDLRQAGERLRNSGFVTFLQAVPRP